MFGKKTRRLRAELARWRATARAATERARAAELADAASLSTLRDLCEALVAAKAERDDARNGVEVARSAWAESEHENGKIREALARVNTLANAHGRAEADAERADRDRDALRRAENECESIRAERDEARDTLKVARRARL